MFLTDGFPGQRLHVLPSPLVQQALAQQPTSRLLVTDAGHFPHAARHARRRPAGSPQAILILCVDGVGWVRLTEPGTCSAGDRDAGSGDGSGGTEPGSHRVRGGDAVLLPPGVPHLYHADERRPWTIWWMHVTGADVPDLLQAITPPGGGPVRRVGDTLLALSLIEQVTDSMGQDETTASLVRAAGAAWHLLALLAAERDQRSERDREPLLGIQQHLRSHLAEPVSVAQLAAAAGLSSSHFSARFRSFTGYSLLEYVKRLRMARARELLTAGDDSIAQVAAGVGYADPFYFSRQFRAVHGQSPSEYRRRAQLEGGPG